MSSVKEYLHEFMEEYKPTVALGMGSIVIDVIGLVFVFMPVLGIIISGFGLLLGVLGIAAGLLAGGSLALRWSAGGLAIGVLAMAMNVAVAYAPAGYIPSRPPPQPWQQIPDRPGVPPPADGGPEG
jgi:hypothetical protein